MDRVLKVICAGAEQDALAAKYNVIARYDGFALVAAGAAEVEAVARAHPAEDITRQYEIKVGGRVIDTARPRFDAKGKLHAHPGYRGIKPVGKGRHHHLVQFV